MSHERQVIGTIAAALAVLSIVPSRVLAAPPTPLPGFVSSDAETLLLQPGPEGMDTHVNSWYPTTNYGDLAWFYSIGLPAGEALLRFDLSSIPAGSTIVSAQVDLWAEFRAGTITFAPIASDWNESVVTWNTRPGSTLLTVTHSMDTCSFGCTKSFDVAEVVRYAIAHPESDFGTKVTANSPNVGWMMASSDHSTPGYRPKLTVVYVPGGVPVAPECWSHAKSIYR